MEFFLLIKYFLSILTLNYVDHDKYIEERVERTDKKINTFTQVYTSLVSDACISLVVIKAVNHITKCCNQHHLHKNSY